MTTMKIHHIGYLVKDIEKSEEQFLALGYKVEKAASFDKYRKVDIEFLNKDGYRIELVEPIGNDSPIYPLLKKFRNSPYHICYMTDDLDKSVKDLIENHYVVMQEPQLAPCIGKGDKQVAFLMSSNIGIVELLEE